MTSNADETKIESAARVLESDTPIERVEIGNPGQPKKLLIYKGRIFVYGPQGEALIDGGFISSNAFDAAAISSDKVSFGGKKYVHDIVFTAEDADSCAWEAGTIYWSDGTTSAVNGGNSGNLTTTNYIYYDGSATLKKTDDHSLAVMPSYLLLAIVEPTADSGGKCLVCPLSAPGATIDGDKVATGKISSLDGKTYFDLSNNKILINDTTRDRVILGKIGTSYGIKVSLPDYSATSDTNVDHFALWSVADDTNENVLVKEKARGSSTVGAGATVNVAHGLGYVPYALVFVETSAGVYRKIFGKAIGGADYKYQVNSTNLVLINTTASSKVFKYYIFYDLVV